MKTDIEKLKENLTEKQKERLRYARFKVSYLKDEHLKQRKRELEGRLSFVSKEIISVYKITILEWTVELQEVNERISRLNGEHIPQPTV